jgi:hypothetical protein
MQAVCSGAEPAHMKCLLKGSLICMCTTWKSSEIRTWHIVEGKARTCPVQEEACHDLAEHGWILDCISIMFVVLQCVAQ